MEVYNKEDIKLTNFKMWEMFLINDNDYIEEPVKILLSFK